MLPFQCHFPQSGHFLYTDVAFFLVKSINCSKNNEWLESFSLSLPFFGNSASCLSGYVNFHEERSNLDGWMAAHSQHRQTLDVHLCFKTLFLDL